MGHTVLLFILRCHITSGLRFSGRQNKTKQLWICLKRVTEDHHGWNLSIAHKTEVIQQKMAVAIRQGTSHLILTAVIFG